MVGLLMQPEKGLVPPADVTELRRWPVLRFLALLDAAAAALDARCVQTFANTGDRATWCDCNDASNNHLGKNTRLMLSLDPHKPRTDRDVTEYKRKRDTKQPPRHVVAQRCAAPSGPQSGASATTASSSTAASPT